MRMTLRQLWDDFAARGLVPGGMETPHEVALQKIGFLCGVIAALGETAMGREIDIEDGDEMLAEAVSNLTLECDRRRTTPSPN